jgi:hypothetical protein
MSRSPRFGATVDSNVMALTAKGVNKGVWTGRWAGGRAGGWEEGEGGGERVRGAWQVPEDG